MSERPEDPDVAAGDLEALADELAEALRGTGPLSTLVAGQAVELFTWRTVDDDLVTAGLAFDSAVHPDPVPTRADTGNRVLVFSADLRSVEVEVLADRVVGQFTPPSAGTVELEAAGGEVVAAADVDDLGFFIIEPLRSGVVRLRCSTATTRLVTDWVRL